MHSMNAANCYRCLDFPWYVRVSLCVSVGHDYECEPCKTAEPIELPFGGGADKEHVQVMDKMIKSQFFLDNQGGCPRRLGPKLGKPRYLTR